MTKRPAITVVVADAGPLISLAVAGRLQLLEAFDKPVKILDVIKDECLRKPGALGEAELQRWFATNHSPAEVVASPFLDIYRKAQASEENGTDPYATVGLGDAAISWLVAKAPRLYGSETTCLVLTEDGPFGDTRLGRNVHVLSTRPFLATLENVGIIPSARAIIQEIANAGRNVSRYQADRPALIGPRQSSKTQWNSSLKAPGQDIERD